MPLLAAEVLEHLQVRRGRMIRPAAAEVRLGDQARDAAMLGLIASSSARYGAGSNGASRSDTSRHSSLGNEMKRTRGSRFLSRSLPGHRLGQPLLAVKPVARGDDEVARRIDRQRGPERLLDRLGAGRRPHDLFEPLAAGLGLQVRDEPPARRRPRCRRSRCRRSAGPLRSSPSPDGDLEPAHVAAGISSATRPGCGRGSRRARPRCSRTACGRRRSSGRRPRSWRSPVCVGV